MITLFAMVGGPHLVGAAAFVVQQVGGDLPVAPLRVEEVGRLVGLSVAGAWLLGLILSRPRGETGGWPWRQVSVFVGVFAVIVADEHGEFSPDRVPTQIAGHLTELILWIWLCVEVAARCGVTFHRLDITRPAWLVRKRTKAERAKAAQGEMVFFAYAAAICASMFLAERLRLLPGPVLDGDQAAAAGVPDLGPHLAHAVWSATVEEVLATALVVAVLTAMRRPRWEALTVVALMRGLPHIYVGLWPALAFMSLGVAAGWLYLRYRRVIPLVLAHAAYNVVNIAVGLPPLLLVCALMLVGAGWSWVEARRAPADALSPGEPSE
ncbi:CPBP family intramembrane metalloprotease [Streptomyces europaeiscabiei]|uniref:CPBP family intramembrane glutamic endopeptidase n=1 Tax=Streptomyces europaeiscabiei TaxID=146819 RepID=UPI0029B16327|nr:CPBP family intramembrane glutamic endopeptidase [Streptomyces europaeiscabiei]MDX3694814.1 CPBP family intramembrane metalloprotease [Streptomyces europaeiscabiei]